MLERARRDLPYVAPELVVERCLGWMVEAAEAGAIDASPARRPPECPPSLGTIWDDVDYALMRAHIELGNVLARCSGAKGSARDEVERFRSELALSVRSNVYVLLFSARAKGER